MRISIDAGKYAGKGLGCNLQGNVDRFYLRNKIEEVTEDAFIVDDKGYIVEYEGKVYRVGNEASKVDYEVSKRSISHKLMAYIGITQLLVRDVRDVDLMVGCPMSTFVNKDKKDKFIDYLKGDVKIKVKGVEYQFNIKSVNVLPESLGIPYKDVAENKKRLVGVIDIGGLNVNGAIYDRLKPIKSSAFTINEGGLILQSKIKKLLNNRYDCNFQDYEIPYILTNGLYIRGERDYEGDGLLLSIFKEHIDSILTECKKYNWNIGGLDLEFTGGGSLDLKTQIEEYLPYAKVSGGAVWDNVCAFDKVGEMLKIGK